MVGGPSAGHGSGNAWTVLAVPIAARLTLEGMNAAGSPCCQFPRNLENRRETSFSQVNGPKWVAHNAFAAICSVLIAGVEGLLDKSKVRLILWRALYLPGHLQALIGWRGEELTQTGLLLRRRVKCRGS